MNASQWTTCYGTPWKGIATEACAAHPAKFSRALIFRIVEHALEEGWVVSDQGRVVDPFGGVGLGALPCALAGMAWYGVELEPVFVTWAHANFALWRRRYGSLPQWRSPVLVQGDSRTLDAVLQTAEVQACISSPPYAAETDRCRKHANKAQDGAGGFRNFYSDNHANLGNPGGVHGLDTFWTAARTIIAHCYAVLRPGGTAIWVVKDYVRKGAIIPFSQQWKTVCEHVGFITLHEHHALQVDAPSDMGLFGAPVEHYHLEYKGRFRSRNEKKYPHTKIDWETVWCMAKVPNVSDPQWRAWRDAPTLEGVRHG